MLELTRSLARLATSEPNDPIVRKALLLLETANTNRARLSPVQRAFVGKGLALAVDAKSIRVGEEPKNWLTRSYDSFLESATAAVEYPGQKMLELANALDAAQQAVENGADDALLQTANTLDKIQEAVSESAANFAAGTGRAVRAATWNLVGPALIVGGVFLAFGWARRGGR
jgi:hypothetical protein